MPARNLWAAFDASEKKSGQRQPAGEAVNCGTVSGMALVPRAGCARPAASWGTSVPRDAPGRPAGDQPGRPVELFYRRETARATDPQGKNRRGNVPPPVGCYVTCYTPTPLQPSFTQVSPGCKVENGLN